MHCLWRSDLTWQVLLRRRHLMSFTSERAQQPLALNIKTQHMQTVSNKWMQRPHPPERERERERRWEEERGKRRRDYCRGRKKRDKWMQCLLTTLNASVLSVEREGATNRLSVCLPSCCVSVCLFCFSDLLLASFCFFSPHTQEECIFECVQFCFFSLFCVCITFEPFACLSQSLHYTLTLSECVCV